MALTLLWGADFCESKTNTLTFKQLGQNILINALFLRKISRTSSITRRFARFVGWMRPDAEISEEYAQDVNFDDDIPVSEYAGIGSAHEGKINIANASGIVRALNKALPEIKTEKEMEVW